MHKFVLHSSPVYMYISVWLYISSILTFINGKKGMIIKSRDHLEGRHMQKLTPKTKYVLWIQLHLKDIKLFTGFYVYPSPF
jgi:hypothetical protein